MLAASRPNLTAFPDSPYVAELQRGPANRRFSPKLEAEYVRACLLDSHTVIRVACVLAALLAALRGVEQAIAGSWDLTSLSHVGFVLCSSIALGCIAWSPGFPRLYLPLASIIVPIRNAVAAIAVTQAAAHGQIEFLMVLPLLVLGPFFFLGLRMRAALLSVVLTAVSFIFSAFVFGLALSVALRSCAFLLLAVVACAVAVRDLEKWSRTSFLESRLIAELAQHDALTGTKNRRVFDEHLARLWQQAIEDGRAIAILLIDVDHFKGYNDRYGHQSGDQTLRRVAQTLQLLVSRPLDVLARYGGEEFAAILYDVDAHQARDSADRMRRAVGELAIEHRGSRISSTVTISVGVAVIEPTAERKPRGALQLADEALYKAKSGGRNRVELMEDAEYRMLVTGIFSQSSLARGS